LFGLTPYFAVLYLVLFLIVVAVGGLGSLKGTLLAALVIGIVDTGGKYMFPQAGNFLIYAITAIVLLFKPAGFYGRE
jgi:branched-chain amino acid transport system permease protein